MSKVELKAEDLEPCPFCGSSSVFPNGVEPAVFVECDGCGASSGTCHGDTEAEAISAWNRRPALSDHRPPVEGWVTAPREPTEEMVTKGRWGGLPLDAERRINIPGIYAAMIAAAPPSPPVEALGVREMVERLRPLVAEFDIKFDPASMYGVAYDVGRVALLQKFGNTARLILSALSTAPLSLGNGDLASRDHSPNPPVPLEGE